MARKPTTLVLFAGEPSGDLHGAKLMKALLEIDPDLIFIGVGGPLMRQMGLEPLLNMEEFETMGFIQVFLRLPSLLSKFSFLKKEILKINPDAVITIDYPDFSLRLLKALKKNNFQGKLIHYICPSVWAWRKKRINMMEKTLDLLLSILPFEKEHFAKSSLTIKYIGNPLVQTLKEHVYKGGNIPSKPLIALFPGSRETVIKRNLPIQCEIAKAFYPDYRIAISCAHDRFLPLLTEYGAPLNATLIPSTYRYELMEKADLALATSGTVNLELALHSTPTLVTYLLPTIDYYLAKYLIGIKLPYYSLPNILLNESVYPEFIGAKIDLNLATESAKELLSTEGKKRLQDQFRRIKKLLGTHEASSKAAEEIYRVFK